MPYTFTVLSTDQDERRQSVTLECTGVPSGVSDTDLLFSAKTNVVRGSRVRFDQNNASLYSVFVVGNLVNIDFSASEVSNPPTPVPAGDTATIRVRVMQVRHPESGGEEVVAAVERVPAGCPIPFGAIIRLTQTDPDLFGKYLPGTTQAPKRVDFTFSVVG